MDKNTFDSDKFLAELGEDARINTYNFINVAIIILFVLIVGMSFFIIKGDSVNDEGTTEKEKFLLPTMSTFLSGDYTQYLSNEYYTNFPGSEVFFKLNKTVKRFQGINLKAKDNTTYESSIETTQNTTITVSVTEPPITTQTQSQTQPPATTTEATTVIPVTTTSPPETTTAPVTTTEETTTTTVPETTIETTIDTTNTSEDSDVLDEIDFPELTTETTTEMTIAYTSIFVT